MVACTLYSPSLIALVTLGIKTMTDLPSSDINDLLTSYTAATSAPFPFLF